MHATSDISWLRWSWMAFATAALGRIESVATGTIRGWIQPVDASDSPIGGVSKGMLSYGDFFLRGVMSPLNLVRVQLCPPVFSTFARVLVFFWFFFQKKLL
jgi:hypothetical protein